MPTLIAIDVGGTQLRAALYDETQFEPLAVKKAATKAREPNAFGRLVEVVQAVLPHNRQVDAIGVSSPGPLDPRHGMIMSTPNIPEWKDFPLTAKLQETFGAPCYLENDASLACLAEWKFGAGRGHHNMLYLTISTGVGGGVIINDQLLEGYHGLATELGHTTLEAEGALCGCGQRGHLEAYSSGTSIERYVAAQLASGRESSLAGQANRSARSIAAAAAAGDALAIEVYRRAGKYLGIGVANFLHSFDPSIVVFGGGVSQSGALLFDAFETSLKERVIHPKYLEGLAIATAALKDDAGLLGARALAEWKQNV